jgi:hypothetical protein
MSLRVDDWRKRNKMIVVKRKGMAAKNTHVGG